MTRLDQEILINFYQYSRGMCVCVCVLIYSKIVFKLLQNFYRIYDSAMLRKVQLLQNNATANL